MSTNDWAVFRQDFTGNEFLVKKGLSKERADELVEEYESHGHHQHYWSKRLPSVPVDFNAMLRELLESGSPLNSAIDVLKHQGASEEEINAAVNAAKSNVQNKTSGP